MKPSYHTSHTNTHLLCYHLIRKGMSSSSISLFISFSSSNEHTLWVFISSTFYIRMRLQWLVWLRQWLCSLYLPGWQDKWHFFPFPIYKLHQNSANYDKTRDIWNKNRDLSKMTERQKRIKCNSFCYYTY